jgi:hypothetical protein
MYRNDEPPKEDHDVLDNCAECDKKLEGPDQQWFCSKACESKHLDNLRREDDSYARAMVEEMEICKSLFIGRS